MSSSNTSDVSAIDIANEEILITNYSGGSKRNIYNLVTGFDIFSSIENNTLSADFYISDGTDLMNTFPLGGEEFIEFTAKTPGRASRSFRFFVDRIEGQSAKSNSMVQTYVLRCVTEDWHKNSYKLISKRYKDKDYDVALNECIVQDLGAAAPIVDATKGKFDYVVNRVRPFQVVDLIKERAVHPKYKSSLFVFYEDFEGYKFKCLEDLMTKGGKYEFSYDISNRASNYDKVINFRNILSLEMMPINSSVEKVVRGAVRNQVRQFDLLHGDYWEMSEYDGSGMWKDYEQMAGDNAPSDHNSSAFTGAATESPGVSTMVFKDSLRPEMEHNKSLHYLRAFEDRFISNGYRIRTYGDTSIMAGEAVNLTIPVISGTTEEPQQQEVRSGVYLIRDLRWICEKSSDGLFNHYCVMDVRKPHLRKKSIG